MENHLNQCQGGAACAFAGSFYQNLLNDTRMEFGELEDYVLMMILRNRGISDSACDKLVGIFSLILVQS